MLGQCEIAAWNEIQGRIWCCELCRDHGRVACNLRQHTSAPLDSVELMLVGVAPPHVAGVQARIAADSATNDPNDNLRSFIMATLGRSWTDLLARGLFLIHAVKCAIIPEDGHQNPPNEVVDACAPLYFAHEIQLVRPPVVVVFGRAPHRALLRVPGVRASMPKGFGLSCSVTTLVQSTRLGADIDA
jgi:uracil-DNA glycosylase